MDRNIIVNLVVDSAFWIALVLTISLHGFKDYKQKVALEARPSLELLSQLGARPKYTETQLVFEFVLSRKELDEYGYLCVQSADSYILQNYSRNAGERHEFFTPNIRNPRQGKFTVVYQKLVQRSDDSAAFQ